MINFLRGVPADESLEKISPLVAEGYKEAINKYGATVLQYGHFGGFKPLRDILGEIYNTDPERIIAGNGGLEVISLFFKSLPPNSTIIVEEATYDRVLLDAMQYGHKVVGVEMTSEGVNSDDLERLLREIPAGSAKVFYGIPFHQNPTGITYTEENRKAVEEICGKQDAICAWDVCYESLRYDGNKNTPIEVSDGGPILMSSFTKTISPGTKCGYMVLPKEMIGHVTNVIANTRINPNLPTQAFIAEFIKSGKYDEFQNVLCDLYKPRMDALNTAMEAHFSETDPVRATGGFSVLLNMPEITEEKEDLFVKSAKEAGVSIGSASAVFAPNILEKNRGKGFFVRTPFPALEPEQIGQGIATLKEVKQSVIGGL
ncbi:PLP-dependent aminotransferase family protein [Desulfobacterales bacterium HSG2]|nr:PLP-dependent aminotransferase family protein [Desulfobacterales bacterium HSG2]